MNNDNNISNKTKINFYLNLVNFLPYLILIYSGLAIQLNYHMHELPDDHLVLSLNKFSWVLIHKISGAISLAGTIVHCILHWKYIKAVTKKIFSRKSKIKVFSSYYLFIIGILTIIPAMLSWIFVNYNNPSRFFFIEIHDKLAMLFLIFTIVHMISRTRWMLKVYQKIKKAREVFNTGKTEISVN